MASSSEEVRLLELYELQNNEGPCLDCFRSGQPATRASLPAMRQSWPIFTERLRQLGFQSAQAVPMRLRTETIGALNIFRAEPGPLPDGVVLSLVLSSLQASFQALLPLTTRIVRSPAASH